MSTLEKVLQLEPINFRYVKELDPDQALRAGFSAQQVQALFPDAVSELNGYLMINPTILQGHIEKAYQEAQLK